MCSMISMTKSKNSVVSPECTIAQSRQLRNSLKGGELAGIGHLPLYQNESSYENEFRLLVHFHASQGRFYTKTRFETEVQSSSTGTYSTNLVPRAHVPFGQHQDTELWNNQFPETKILGLPASRRMRGLV